MSRKGRERRWMLSRVREERRKLTEASKVKRLSYQQTERVCAGGFQPHHVRIASGDLDDIGAVTRER